MHTNSVQTRTQKCVLAISLILSLLNFYCSTIVKDTQKANKRDREQETSQGPIFSFVFFVDSPVCRLTVVYTTVQSTLANENSTLVACFRWFFLLSVSRKGQKIIGIWKKNWLGCTKCWDNCQPVTTNIEFFAPTLRLQRQHNDPFNNMQLDEPKPYCI